MKHLRLIALLACLVLTVRDVPQLSAETPASPAAATQPSVRAAALQDGISVYFSPNSGRTDAIVAEIDAAEKSIHCQAYSFTSARIAKAVVEAHKRGVEIVVVLDKSQRTASYSSLMFFANQEIKVMIDDKDAIAHNKVILIDGTTIITGSFNFTKAAEESNAENLLIIRGKAELYDAYERNLQKHLAHAVKYEGLSEDGEGDCICLNRSC